MDDWIVRLFFVCCLFLFHFKFSKAFHASCSVLFLLFLFFQLAGGLYINAKFESNYMRFKWRCTYRWSLLHKVINVFLCLFILDVLSIHILFFIIHLLHTLGHLFVVTTAGQAVLGRWDSLTKLLILELHSLCRTKNMKRVSYRWIRVELAASCHINATKGSQKEILTSSRAVKYAAPYSKMFSGWSRRTSRAKSCRMSGKEPGIGNF